LSSLKSSEIVGGGVGVGNDFSFGGLGLGLFDRVFESLSSGCLGFFLSLVANERYVSNEGLVVLGEAGGDLEHLSSSFAVTGSDQRSVDVLESSLLEELVSSVR